MSDFRKYLDEQLKDDEFKKEWEDSEPEYNLVRELIAARKECHMTQKELAEKTGINQAITPGFRLPVKYIIHAVSSRFIDGNSGEENRLRDCYGELWLSKGRGRSNLIRRDTAIEHNEKGFQCGYGNRKLIEKMFWKEGILCLIKERKMQ